MTSLPEFDQAHHRTLRDHVYAQICEALRGGQFEPGQKVTLQGLAAAFGVSSTPVREAVGRLQAEGALVVEPNSSIRVPLLTAEDMHELRELRVMLEGLATERAVTRLTEADIAELYRLDAEIARHRAAKDFKAMIPLIALFHLTVYRRSGMPHLVRVIEGLWMRTGPHIHLLFRGYAQRERGQLRAGTLEAIKRRDAFGARQSMEKDIAGAADYLIAHFENPER